MYVIFLIVLVCEVEIEYGLLQAENTKRSCVWFHRVISGLESSEDGDNAEFLKYTDYCPDGLCLNDGTHPQALLHNLKNKKMKEVMHDENIFTYDATWTPKGNNYSNLNNNNNNNYNSNNNNESNNNNFIKKLT